MIFCQKTLPGSQEQEPKKTKKQKGIGSGGRRASYKTMQKSD
jgi:hypothetical protein